jgi:hypothetical protein
LRAWHAIAGLQVIAAGMTMQMTSRIGDDCRTLFFMQRFTIAGLQVNARLTCCYRNGMAAVAAIEPFTLRQPPTLHAAAEPFTLRQPPTLHAAVAPATVAGVYAAATASFWGTIADRASPSRCRNAGVGEGALLCMAWREN